jgi:hypothetical protein
MVACRTVAVVGDRGEHGVIERIGAAPRVRGDVRRRQLESSAALLVLVSVIPMPLPVVAG